MSDVDQMAAPRLESFSLGELAHIEMGQSPDSRYVVDDPFVGHPFLQGNAEFGAVSPTPKYGCLRPAKLCKTNDILISVRAPVGAVNIADGDYCIGRGLAAIRVEGITPSLLKEVMTRNSSALRRVAQGTTFEAISKNDLRSLPLTLPPQKNWPLLARILDALETAIQETESIIAKLKAVKQGLLHDLLTRGIDANGELRPLQPEAPNLYKSSLLGWIPMDWVVAPLEAVAESLVDGPFGSNLKTVHYVETPGVRVVRLQNIFEGTYDDSERAFISEKHAASLSRNRVLGGDVLIASLGDANYPVGRSCCYPTELPVAVNKADCFRFRSNVRSRNEFIMFSMNSAAVRRQTRKYEQGVTMKRINLGNLRRVNVALPSVAEQDLIVERLIAAQRQIELAELEFQKLCCKKLGLMDDLLTGRVRVTPLLPSESTA